VAGARVVMVAISPLLGDIISRLAEGRGAIEIVAAIASKDSLEERLRALSPDVILLGLDPGEDHIAAAARAGFASCARVLALSHDARQAWLHEAGKPAHALPDISQQDLIAAIRGI
jgi:chemotaxis response regulator CheB